MDDHEEAILVLSQELATNPKENAMLTALVEKMLKSSLKGMISHDMYVGLGGGEKVHCSLYKVI